MSMISNIANSLYIFQLVSLDIDFYMQISDPTDLVPMTM